MDFKNSKTYANLQKAFQGECMAYTKYQFYAKKAKKEGMNIVSDIFDETAKNEKEHAKLFFKKLHEGDIPLTAENLLDCIAGESHEDRELYRHFAQEAQAEGYDDVAKLFNLIADIEHHHCERYEAILAQIKKDELFKDSDEIMWICSNCGHIHKGKEAPEVCPVCAHPKAYFSRLNEK